MEMTFKVADNEELVGWVLSFGGEVTIIQPEVLRGKVRDEARRIVRLPEAKAETSRTL
jgi:predicted DNA-binding transcriptional regulator YafY